MPQESLSVPGKLQIGLTCLVALVVAGTWLPATWLWGLNHANWLAWPLRVAAPALGLALIWTPLGRILGQWLVASLDPVLPGRRLVAYGIVPVIGGLAFWLGAETTHLLGDGQTLANMLPKGRLFHGFDGLTYHLAARLYQLDPSGKPAAFRILAIISCLSGVAYLIAAAWSARRLVSPGSLRILLYGLLIATSPLQLFMGYAEVYAPLSVALLVFLTCLLLFLTGRGRYWPVPLAWSVAFLLHLNALFLSPLLLVAVLWPDADGRRPWGRRLFTLAAPVLAAVLVVVVLYRLAGIDGRGLLADFGPSAGGDAILRGWTGAHGLLAWRHVKDVVNLLLLLAPVATVVLAVGIVSVPRRRLCATGLVLVAGSAWLLVLAIVVHLKLGAVRDWDLLAPHAALFVLAGWFVVASRLDRSALGPGFVGAALGVAALVAAPWFAVNASEGPAVARLAAVAGDLAPYPRALIHEQMAYHFQLRENPAETEYHYRRAAEICPANLRFLGIYGTHLLNQGEISRAITVYDQAVAADSTYAYGLQMAVTARALRQDFSEVLPLARRLARRGLETARTAEAHAIAAEQAGLAAEAITAYRRAAVLDPGRLDLLERAGGLALQSGDLSSAEQVFSGLLRTDAARSSAALGLADAIWLGYPGQGGVTSAGTWRPRLQTVLGLIDRVLADPATGASKAGSLRQWRAEVRAALAALGE